MTSRSGPPLIALALLLPLSAGADNFFDDSWYVSPMISYIDDDRDRNVDDGLAGYHLGIGKTLNLHSGVEFSAIGAFLNADGFDADQRQWGFGVDYIRRFGDAAYLVPYVVAGGGFIKSQTHGRTGRDGAGPMTSLGLGVVAPLPVFKMSLRIELRMRHDYSVDTRRDFLLGFGLQRTINPKPALFLDRDGDGVVDSRDRCGDTPRHSIVDSYGCARSAEPESDSVPDDDGTD